MLVRTCTFHACADMYFCLFVQFDMSSTFARLKFSPEPTLKMSFQFSVFSVPKRKKLLPGNRDGG